MRDILFRGMAVEEKAGFKICEWVYGSLIRKTTGAVYISNVGTDEEIEVNPATVGQYTGLKDRSGHMIYEGDIVKDEIADAMKFGEVHWDLGDARFYLDFGGFGWPVEYVRYHELIGNRWNNPELLGRLKGSNKHGNR